MACEKIEKFEEKAYQVGSMGSCNLMSQQDMAKYDDLIDGLSYTDDEENKEKKYKRK